LEPIIVNIATFEKFDKRMYRYLMMGLILIIVILAIVNIRCYLKNRSIIIDYQKRINGIDVALKEENRLSSQSADDLDDIEKENLERHIAFVNTIILHDIFPWPKTLDLIEKTIPDDIILDRVAHSPNYQTLTLQGHSKTTESVAVFLDGLKKQILFKEASLSSLSIDSLKEDEQSSKSIIKFDLSCTLDLNRIFQEKTGLNE